MQAEPQEASADKATTPGQRERFEAAYAAHYNQLRNANYTAEHIASMRKGEGYGERAFLNGWWEGWKAAEAQQDAPSAPTAQVFERNNERTLTSTLLISSSHFAVEVTPELVASWSDAECQAVEDYCLAIHYRASDNPGVVIPPRPAVLGGAA